MNDRRPTDLEAEFDRITEALRRPLSEGQRSALKNDIVDLFRRTEASIAQLTAFKERIRELVAGFKALPSMAEPA